MNESLILKIRDYVMSQSRTIPFPPAPDAKIKEAEKNLGFSIPTLLKLAYSQVGNGGFGPGRGGSIIGLSGGYESDFGTLIETYEQLKGDQEIEGKEWPAGLLPFCEWGCNVFSCVDCNEVHQSVYLFEDFDLQFKNYTLHDFFRMWVEGVDILSYGEMGSEMTEIINPFTGEKTRVTKRRKK